MKSVFSPDICFDNIYEITPEFYEERGINTLILDIDQTLVTYGNEKPTQENIDWINNFREHNFNIVIASNNGKERVDKFCRGLDIYYTYKSAKPIPRCVDACCKKFGVKANNIAIIGDQIFTDVLCANLGGAFATLVRPIDNEESNFIKFKRVLEKPIIRSYWKKKWRERKDK